MKSKRRIERKTGMFWMMRLKKNFRSLSLDCEIRNKTKFEFELIFEEFEGKERERELEI